MPSLRGEERQAAGPPLGFWREQTVLLTSWPTGTFLYLVVYKMSPEMTSLLTRLQGHEMYSPNFNSALPEPYVCCGRVYACGDAPACPSVPSPAAALPKKAFFPSTNQESA